MICTGTGSAPFRAFTERRRRAMPDAAGRLMLFFGARRPEELPYFGPLQKVPDTLLGKHFCYSRVPGSRRTTCRTASAPKQPHAVAAAQRAEHACLHLRPERHGERRRRSVRRCVPQAASLDWSALKTAMRDGGRYHVETY